MNEPMRCPCCQQPMDLPEHKFGERWTKEQIAWMLSMQGLLTQKALARVWGVSVHTIGQLICQARNRR